MLYLGQNVPVDQFVEEMRRLSPDLVMISATTESSIPGVIAMAEAVQAMDSPRPVFGFGGGVFNANPHPEVGLFPVCSWVKMQKLPWRTSSSVLSERRSMKDGASA